MPRSVSQHSNGDGTAPPKEVSEEVFYREIKLINGIQSPTKMLIQRDGKKFVECEVLDEVRHEKLDEKLFAKP